MSGKYASTRGLRFSCDGFDLRTKASDEPGTSFSLIYPTAEALTSETSVRIDSNIIILIQFVIYHTESKPDIALLYVAAVCGRK